MGAGTPGATHHNSEWTHRTHHGTSTSLPAPGPSPRWALVPLIPGVISGYGRVRWEERPFLAISFRHKEIFPEPQADLPACLSGRLRVPGRRPSPGCTSRPERKPGPATHGDEPNTVSDLVCRLSGQAAHGLFHNRSRGRESPPARGTDSRPQPRKPPREQVSPRGLLQMTPQPPLPARGLAGDPDAQAPRELRPDPRPTESLG